MVTPVKLGKIATGAKPATVQLSKAVNSAVKSSVSQASNYVKAVAPVVVQKTTSSISQAQKSYSTAEKIPLKTQSYVYDPVSDSIVESKSSVNSAVSSSSKNSGSWVDTAKSWLGLSNAEEQAKVTKELTKATTAPKTPVQTTMSAGQETTTVTQGGYQQVQLEKAAIASGLVSDSWGDLDSAVSQMALGEPVKGLPLTLPIVTQQEVKTASRGLKDLLAGFDYNTSGNYTLPQQYADMSYASVDDSMCDLFGDCAGANNGILGAVQGAINAVINVSTEAIAAALAGLPGAIQALGNNVKSLADSAANSVKTIATVAIGLPLVVAKAVKDAGSYVYDLIRPYWEGMQSNYNYLVEKVTGAMTWLYEQMPQQIKSIVDSINGGFKTIADSWEWMKTNVIGKVTEYINNPKKLIDDVWNYVSPRIDEAKQWMGDQLELAKQWMWSKATEIYDYVMANWKEILGYLIPPEIQLLVGALYKLLTEYAPQIADWINKAAANPEQAAKDLWDTAQEYAKVAQTEGEKMMREWCQTPLGSG